MLQTFSDPVLVVTGSVLLGLVVGSFLNVVIHRLPRIMERQWRAECADFAGTAPPPVEERYNLVVPRSSCPSCGHLITALENIPLLSYAVLRGRCSACRTRIPVRYPIVEALGGLVAGYAGWRFGFSATALAAMTFSWTMITLAFIDLDTFYLPDSITLPLLWTGLLLNHATGAFTDLGSAVTGAAAGYLALWTVYWLFKFATGKEGMGYGDFKLLAAIGAWLGWALLPAVILISSLVGATIGIALILFARRERSAPIPFGPYLAIAGLIALFHGEAITRRYLDFF